MTIAQIKTLAEAKRDLTADKVAALRVLIAAHIATPDWDVETLRVLMADVATGYSIITRYNTFCTTLDQIDANYTTVSSAYTAARTDFENKLAAMTPIVQLAPEMALIVSTQKAYLDMKTIYDKYNGATPAVALATFEASQPDRMIGHYKN